MLREAPNVRQIAGDPNRRWFCDEFFDLIVWYDNKKSIIGFQLCYGRAGQQKAFTWHNDEGFSHNAIDDGEGDEFRHKATPILAERVPYHSKDVLEHFSKSAQGLDAEIADLVLTKLAEHGKEQC